MKKTHLIPLAIAAALIGLLALIFGRTGATPSNLPAGVGERLLRDFPLNEVARIRVFSPTGEAVVQRNESGWVVPAKASYPADFDQISRLLRKAWETKIVQTVTAGPSAFGRLQLETPTSGENAPGPDKAGTLVEFFDASDKLLASLILGKEPSSGDPSSPWSFGGAGRFVLDPKNPGRVAVVAETFPEATPRANDWLSSDFFSVQKARSIKVFDRDGNPAWHAFREKNVDSFALADIPKGRAADQNKLSPLSTLLSYPRIEDVLAADTPPETTGLDKPVKATIETFDNFTYEFAIGSQGNEATRHFTLSVSANIPEKREAPDGESEEDKKRLDKEFETTTKALREKLEKEKRFESWIFLLPETQVADLLKTREDFLEPKPEKPSEPANTPATPPSTPAPKSTPAKKK